MAGLDEIYIYRYTANTTYFGNFTITSTTVPSTGTSWSDWTGKRDEEDEKTMYAFSNSSFRDSYTFDFDTPMNEVYFTNTGQQVCYVMEVVIKDDPNYQNAATRAAGGGSGTGFTIKAEDLHSKSLKFD